MNRFPDDFLWGVATSAFQIEGGLDADGRGESIWDRFAAKPGNIEDGSSGRRACEHYRLFKQDVALMGALGVQAYRFSIAWPRVFPMRLGSVNEAGVDFYDALVDALLEGGIRPFVTLYHWDLPQALQDVGGWASRATADAFVAYADVVSRRLGDRVSHWITHNEPWCVSVLGHRDGVHAPGHRDPAESLAVAHHLLLSHGMAVPVLRGNAPGAEVGIVLNLVPGEPASPSAADGEAARRFDGSFNRWFLDPLYGRGYPSDVMDDYRTDGVLPPGSAPFVRLGDLDVIATPTDFLGVNYYTRAVLRSETVPEEENEARTVDVPPDRAHTDMGWEVYPDGLRTLLLRVQQDYAPSRVYVTECGCAYGTGPGEDGRVRDERRVAFLKEHFAAAQRAIAAGVPLGGVFVWSLLDNFEWAYGYTKRFGIVWVDFETQQRIPKDSATWYREVISRNQLDGAQGGEP